jgi:hypothetical protein
MTCLGETLHILLMIKKKMTHHVCQQISFLASDGALMITVLTRRLRYALVLTNYLQTLNNQRDSVTRNVCQI